MLPSCRSVRQKKFHRIKHLIVNNTANHKVVVCCIFSDAAIQDKVKPIFGIRIEFQCFQLMFPAFLKHIPGNNSVFPTAFELAAPLRCLHVQRSNIKATSKIHIRAGMNQVGLCNFQIGTVIKSYISTPLSFIRSRRSSTIYSRLWVCRTSYSGTM